MSARNLLTVVLMAALSAHAGAPRIVEPVDGAVLNRHDGDAADGGLWVTVKGTAAGAAVTVNGALAAVKDGRFEARVLLRARETRIVARSGDTEDAVTVLWDRNSFPRYRLSVDDNILFLKDIARNSTSYGSIFDNAYLAFFRDLNRKYGTKVHFNIYYETDGFNLSQMPDKFRGEWQRNSDWLRLTFHARADKPDRPYLGAPAARVIEDFRLVRREIERFAGSELLSPVTTIHWGEATREACAALRAEGIQILAGYFELRDGKPRVSYYLDPERVAYLSGRDYWKDTSLDMVFIRHDMVINSVPLPDIVPRLEKLAADPHQSEVLELMIHEQYFHPGYVAYLPDYRQRVERAVEWAARKGYRPVFYGDGFLGVRR